MSGRFKQVQLTKKQFNSLRNFLISDMHLDNKETNLIIKLYKKGVIDKDFIYRLEIGEGLDKDIMQIKTCLNFTNKVDYEIMNYLMKKVRTSVRKKIIETYTLNPIECYIYNILFNAKKSGNVVGTKTLINIMKQYKRIQITEKNEGYYKKVIARMRKKVANKLRNQTQNVTKKCKE